MVAAIVAHPDDDTPRLVFADWLDDSGEADRAAFIRAQCEAARRPGNTADALARQADALLRAHREDWEAPIAAFGGTVEAWHRGMPAQVRIPIQRFLNCADELFSAAPLITTLNLTLVSTRREVRDLVRCPHLRQVAALELQGPGLDAYGLVELSRCPYLSDKAHLVAADWYRGEFGDFVRGPADRIKYLLTIASAGCNLGILR